MILNRLNKKVYFLTREDYLNRLYKEGKNYFNIQALKTALEIAEEQENEFGEKYKEVYVGKIFDIAPSGKYYTFWACSNVSEWEMEKDEIFFEGLREGLGEHGLYIVEGEGDPTDLFVGRIIEEDEKEEEEDFCSCGVSV